MQSFRIYMKDGQIQYIHLPNKNQDRFPVVMCGTGSENRVIQTKQTLGNLLGYKFKSILFLTASTGSDNVREIYFMEINRFIVESAYNNRVE